MILVVCILLLQPWAAALNGRGSSAGTQPSPAKPAASPARIYLTDRADEDWSFLKDRAYRSDFWDPIKYIALGRENWYLTLGGEVRMRPEGFRIRGDETTPATRDNYLLQRYLFSADLHMGKRFRFFSELQSGLISGKLRSPRPTDKNLAEIHQGFVEFRTPLGERRNLMVRVGRQELAIGSSRLISAAQGLNVKRSFDGATVHYGSQDWRVELGAAKLVKLRPGAFDDPPDHEQSFWGVAFFRRGVPFKTASLSAYYLGLDRRVSVYQQGIGPERRHTIGGKMSGGRGNFDFNYDAIFQWGRFRGGDASAWAVSTESGYRFPKRRFRPRLSLRFNTATGDKDRTDNRLESFNPLFPGTSYSGTVGLLGPTNMTDVTPALQLFLRRSLLVAVECPSYFRSSRGDGVYGIDLRLLIPATAGTARYVGTNPGVSVGWLVTRHISVGGAITRFLSGPFLERTFVANGFGFYSASVSYRF